MRRSEGEPPYRREQSEKILRRCHSGASVEKFPAVETITIVHEYPNYSSARVPRRADGVTLNSLKTPPFCGLVGDKGQKKSKKILKNHLKSVDKPF